MVAPTGGPNLQDSTYSTEDVERLQNDIRQYILQKSATIANDVNENNQFVDKEIGTIENVFPEVNKGHAVPRKNIEFTSALQEKVMKNGDTLLVQPLNIDGVAYVALKVPSSIASMRIEDIMPQFSRNSNENWFPKLDINMSL